MTYVGWFQHFLDLQLVGRRRYSATLLHAHDTSTRATMNLAVGDGVVAAGQDGTCCLMKTGVSRQEGGGKAAAEDGEIPSPGPGPGPSPSPGPSLRLVFGVCSS